MFTVHYALTDQPVFGMNVLGQENPVREATVHQGLDKLDPLCITWHVHLSPILEENNERYIKKIMKIS